MSAKRAAIIELHRADKKNSEIVKLLKAARSTVTTLLRGFENSKVLKIVLMWKTAIFWKMPKVVDAIRARVWRNPTRFIMGMACDMNVSDKMMKNTVNHFPGFWSKEVWPPSSPDLKAMDCCVRSLLEADACGSLHGLVEALKRPLVIAWAKMPQETLRKAAEGFRNRLKRVIQAKEGYIE